MKEITKKNKNERIAKNKKESQRIMKNKIIRMIKNER
jgi:hypothetical protein